METPERADGAGGTGVKEGRHKADDIVADAGFGHAASASEQGCMVRQVRKRGEVDHIAKSETSVLQHEAVVGGSIFFKIDVAVVVNEAQRRISHSGLEALDRK